MVGPYPRYSTQFLTDLAIVTFFCETKMWSGGHGTGMKGGLLGGPGIRGRSLQVKRVGNVFDQLCADSPNLKYQRVHPPQD